MWDGFRDGQSSVRKGLVSRAEGSVLTEGKPVVFQQETHSSDQLFARSLRPLCGALQGRPEWTRESQLGGDGGGGWASVALRRQVVDLGWLFELERFSLWTEDSGTAVFSGGTYSALLCPHS